MSSFTSQFASRLQCFLDHKRGLGFAYLGEESLLHDLERLTAGTDPAPNVLDEALVRRFVAAGPRGSRSHRLTLVRQLARFLAVEEPGTFIPPRRFLGAKRQRPVIRVLTREEAGRFLCACDEMTDSSQYPHRGLIHGTLLRVLLLTGLRRGEGLALEVADVDLETGVLLVRKGKFGKTRFVPVANDLRDRLRDYDAEIRRRVPDRGTDDAFFPGPDGHGHGKRASLYTSFRRMLDAVGILHGGRGEGPRLHDLRHTFAVLRLITWYEQGADLNAKLPLLATYLGHIGLTTSQVYLHMTRDLAGEVVRRFEARFGDIITSEVAA